VQLLTGPNAADKYDCCLCLLLLPRVHRTSFVFPRQRHRHSLLLPHTTVGSVSPDDDSSNSTAALLPQRPRGSITASFRRFSTTVTPLTGTAGLDSTPVVAHHGSSSSMSSGTISGAASSINDSSSSSTAAANSSSKDVEEARSPVAVQVSSAAAAPRRSSSGTGASAGSGNRRVSFVQVQPAAGSECDAV
jgi:hypothetical protein